MLTVYQSPTSLLFLAGSYVNYPTGSCWLQIINSHQHKQELMCLERPRILSSSFRPSFSSLPPFTSFFPFSIVFLYILPFREKCCKSFPQKGVLGRRQRGARRRKSKADIWPLCPPQLCHSTLKSHPYPLRTTCSPHSPYIQDSQPHSSSSEHHVLCNFFLLLIFLKNIGEKIYWFGEEDSLHGVSNQDFL